VEVVKYEHVYLHAYETTSDARTKLPSTSTSQPPPAALQS